MLPSIHLVVVIDPLGGAPLGGADVIAVCWKYPCSHDVRLHKYSSITIDC